MKRTAGYLLAAIGVALLVAAPLLRFYSLPQIEKTPLNFYFVEKSTGVGDYLDPGTLHFHHGALFVTRTFKGIPDAGGDTTATWNVFAQTVGSIGNQINITNDRWRFDRHSGESMPLPGTTPQYSGHWLRFPFNTEKKTYSYWDPTALKAFPARYVGEKQVLGHTTYEFKSIVPPTKIDSLTVPGSLIGQPNKPAVNVDVYYSNPASVVNVDPRTGTEVTGSSHKVETFRLPGSAQDVATVLDVNLVPTQESAQGLTNKAQDGIKKLNLVGIWLPIACLLLGGLALALAIYLLWRREPESESPRTVELPSTTPEQRIAGATQLPSPRPAQTIEIGEKSDLRGPGSPPAT